MPITNLDGSNLPTIVAENEIVLIDCWAPWCAACKDFAPVFDALAARRSNVVFAKLDTEANTHLVEELEVKNIPTLILFRDGIMLFKQPGYQDEKGLESILSQAEQLDMDMVRKELAREQSESGNEPGSGSSNG